MKRNLAIFLALAAFVMTMSGCGDVKITVPDVDSSESYSQDADSAYEADVQAESEYKGIFCGSAEVEIDGEILKLSGAYVIDGIDASISGGTYASSDSDQNVFLVINGGSLTLSNAKLVKNNDDSDTDELTAANSAVLVVADGSSAFINDCVISSGNGMSGAIYASNGADITIDGASYSGVLY